MGYRFQFITLAGFHALNLSMFELATGYGEQRHDRLRGAAGAGVRAGGRGLHGHAAPARGGRRLLRRGGQGRLRRARRRRWPSRAPPRRSSSTTGRRQRRPDRAVPSTCVAWGHDREERISDEGRHRLSGRRQPHRLHRGGARGPAGRRRRRGGGAQRHVRWSHLRPAGVAGSVPRRPHHGRRVAARLLGRQRGQRRVGRGGERLARRREPARGDGDAPLGQPLPVPACGRAAVPRAAGAATRGRPSSRRRSRCCSSAPSTCCRACSGPSARRGARSASTRCWRRRPSPTCSGRSPSTGGSTGTGCSPRTRPCGSCPTRGRTRSGSCRSTRSVAAHEPTSAADILDRRNELAGNLSLSQELFFIEKMNELVAAGALADTKYRHDRGAYHRSGPRPGLRLQARPRPRVPVRAHGRRPPSSRRLPGREEPGGGLTPSRSGRGNALVLAAFRVQNRVSGASVPIEAPARLAAEEAGVDHAGEQRAAGA